MLLYFVQLLSITTLALLTIGFMTIRLRGSPAASALVRNAAVSIADSAAVTCGRSALKRLTNAWLVKFVEV